MRFHLEIFFIIGVFLRVLFKINNSPFPQIPGEEKPKLSWDTFSLILSLCHSVQVTFIAVMMMMNIKDIIIIINNNQTQVSDGQFVASSPDEKVLKYTNY